MLWNVIPALLLVATMCAANGEPTKPVWPKYFETEWILYNVYDATNPPPYKGPLGAPTFGGYNTSTGRTFYDSTIEPRRMLEVYDEHCVPIFESGSNWPCKFLNVNGTVYLMATNPDKTHSPCCIFETDFYPPPPDFLTSRHIPFNQTTIFQGEEVNYWGLTEGEGAPFGYGFSATNPTPRNFFFAGFPAWASQTFIHFRDIQPPAEIWNVPAVCKNPGPCPQ